MVDLAGFRHGNFAVALLAELLAVALLSVMLAYLRSDTLFALSPFLIMLTYRRSATLLAPALAAVMRTRHS